MVSIGLCQDLYMYWSELTVGADMPAGVSSGYPNAGTPLAIKTFLESGREYDDNGNMI